MDVTAISEADELTSVLIFYRRKIIEKRTYALKGGNGVLAIPTSLFLTSSSSMDISTKELGQVVLFVS